MTQIQWWIWNKQIFLVKFLKLVHRYYFIKLQILLFNPNLLPCSFCLHTSLCSWATHIHINSISSSLSHTPFITHTTFPTPSKQESLKPKEPFTWPLLELIPLANENLWKIFFLIKSFFSLHKLMGLNDDSTLQWCFKWESLYPMEH